MADSNYWSRFAGGRLTRRTLVARGAVVGTGMAGIALVGCSSSNNNNNNNRAATVAPSATRAATAPASAASPAASRAAGSPAASVRAGSPAASARAGSPAAGIANSTYGKNSGVQQKLEAPKTKGGTLRRFAYTALPIDTLDPHETTFGPTYDLHSLVFSKVLAYDDVFSQSLTPDLAASIPEQPDKLTYIIKVNPNAKWHSKTPLAPDNPIAGQPVTAADIKYSIERQTNEKSPKYGVMYRSSQWKTVDKIEVTDANTLKITTKGPISPFLHFLGDTNAFIVSQKLVDAAKDEMNGPNKMIGSGPFILDKFEALKIARFTRNPDWFLKDAGFAPGRPFLDAIEDTFAPQDDNTIIGALKSKQVDGAGFNDQTNADAQNKALAGTNLAQSPTTGTITTRFACDHGPFKDVRLRQAVNLAYDRNAVGQGIFQGFFKFSPSVAWPLTRWALPQADLLKKPGYRFQQADRDADIKQAKQLLDAAGGTAAVPGDTTIWYSSIPAYLAAYFPVLQKNLKDTLGLSFQGHLDQTGYTEILPALNDHKVDYYWSYDNGWIDLDDWVYPLFHTGEPKNTMGLSDKDLDALLEKQRAEFDFAARQKLGFDIQNMLLDKLFPRAESVNSVLNNVGWNYVKNSFTAPWFGQGYLAANQWLDTSDPSYSGRPT